MWTCTDEHDVLSHRTAYIKTSRGRGLGRKSYRLIIGGS